MKRSLIIVLLVFTNLVTAQIKIGDNPQTLDASSLLELESSSKALVISRVSEAEMLAITPLQGAIVYNTDASCIFYYDGTTWNNLCGDTSTGGIAWGDITGDISTQTDLAQNYVDRNTLQTNIAGEKTFINKLTVNTGTLTDQAAEFLGRVKGENGTEDEDFVTKAQLDASGGGGTWGTITGDITTQTDLATEFLKYVDLTTPQSIAGEKTLSDKLTVNTGTITDQAAEFLGRVKGENGTAPEDFVTLAQLDASGSLSGTEGSIFFADDAGVPDENNTNLFWNNTNKQLKIGSFVDDIETYQVFTDDLTTLNIQGSVSKPIDNATVLTEEHHTIIINWNTASITLPDPSTCYGRIYIIKIDTDNVDIPITNFSGYEDSESLNSRFFPDNKVTQIQSTGYRWEQIN